MRSPELTLAVFRAVKGVFAARAGKCACIVAVKAGSGHIEVVGEGGRELSGRGIAASFIRAGLFFRKKGKVDEVHSHKRFRTVSDFDEVHSHKRFRTVSDFDEIYSHNAGAALDLFIFLLLLLPVQQCCCF